MSESKMIQYLGKNLTKEYKTCSWKTIRHQGKKVKMTNKWKYVPYLLVGKLILLKMTILHKEIFFFLSLNAASMEAPHFPFNIVYFKTEIVHSTKTPSPQIHV